MLMEGQAQASVVSEEALPLRPLRSLLTKLHISMFGELRVELRDELDEKQRTPQIWPMNCGGALGRLLVCLTLRAPHAVSREQLSALLYPDHLEPQARRMLTDAIYRLRREFECVTGGRKANWLITEGDMLRLNSQLVSTDLQEFVRLVQTPCVENWQRAIDLYRGELLEGLDAQWADQRRIEMQACFLRTLEQSCAALSENGHITQALAVAQRWICADPLREEAYCTAMQLCVKLGRYAHALQHFERLKQVLAEELNIEPGGAAHSLARDIRAELQHLANEERRLQAAYYQAESLRLIFLHPAPNWRAAGVQRDAYPDWVCPAHAISVVLARVDAPLGKPLPAAERILVKWVVNAGDEDAQVLRAQGKVGLRRYRLRRLVYQARAQGAVPTDVDLARALGVTVRTIERDMAALRALGAPAPTRRRQLVVGQSA